MGFVAEPPRLPGRLAAAAVASAEAVGLPPTLVDEAGEAPAARPDRDELLPRPQVKWRTVFRALGALVFTAYVSVALVIGAGALSSSAGQALARPPFTSDSQPLLAEPARLVEALTGPPEQTVAPSPLLFVPDWKGTDRINVLLLGTDQRDSERTAGVPTRTDTMIVVSIDPVGKGVAMISLPRDMWVSIPGLGEERLNVAYPYGEMRHVPGGGAGLLSRTIEQNFGITATHFAMVNFPGFEDVVNAVGGIVIDVPRPVKDDAYPTADYGVERVYFAPGPQLMNGATALKYARSRHADNDLARNSRQQQVLLAIRDRALRLDALARLPSLVDIGLRAVQTDFSAAELMSLGKLASQVGSDQVKTLVIGPPLVRDFRGLGGAALLMPDKPGIRRAIQQVLDETASS